MSKRIPFDNEERADFAADTILTMDMEDDTEGNIIDLMTNLLHLADREGLDPYEMLRFAQHHYEIESGKVEEE